MTAITALTAQNTLGVFGVHAGAGRLHRASRSRSCWTISAPTRSRPACCTRADVIEAVCDELAALRAGRAAGGRPGDGRQGRRHAARGGRGRRRAPAAGRRRHAAHAERAGGRARWPASRSTTSTARSGQRRSCCALAGQGGAGEGRPPGRRHGHRRAGRRRRRRACFDRPRIDTRHTHGTGCTLASAIAAGLAQGLPLSQAVERARAYCGRPWRPRRGWARDMGR